MSQQAQLFHLDDITVIDFSRFMLDVRAAIPASTIAWADRMLLHRDLAAMIVEARGRRRPELLCALVRCVYENLRRGDPRIAQTVRMYDTSGELAGRIDALPSHARPENGHTAPSLKSLPRGTGPSPPISNDLIVSARSIARSSAVDVEDYFRLLNESSNVLLEVSAVGCLLADHDGEVQVAAWSSDEVLNLEELMLLDRQGPGVESYATGQPVVNIDRTTARRRWPSIATGLTVAGFESMHALPLHVGGEIVGVLNLYFAQLREFHSDDLALCRALIQVAGIRLGQANASGHHDGASAIFQERYQVDELIGNGGIAEVHLAHDADLNRKVAIKTPRADQIWHPGLLEQFRREGRTGAKLEHPGIVAVLGAGDSEIMDHRGDLVRRPHIVMEHVPGVTLQKLVKTDGALRPGEALRITADILSALEYIHEQGVVHGDISSTNVMLSTEGDVKVMDFGSSHEFTGSDPQMTQSLEVTPAYSSPERAHGRASDIRADLYSAGCVLYELLTGFPPFEGDSSMDVAHQHVHRHPQLPSVHRPEIGDRLDAVVLSALAKAPEERYQSARQFHDDLLGLPAITWC